MTYLEAAYHVLQEVGAPLHYEEIAQRALAQGYIAPKGLTPPATMGSRLYTDTKDINSRFVRTGRGLFAIKEQRAGDVTQQVAAINENTRQQLRDLLQTMPPDRFETLIYELLLQMGFDENSVTVTPYGSDGGIDVVGVYRAAGLTEVNAAVQVKRWKHNVQAPTVTQVRGSLQVHQQGIIITTSDFSRGARAEAGAVGKTRIGLINGEELLDLLLKHQIGVTERPLTVVTLDDAWWGELLDAPQLSGVPMPVAAPPTLPAQPVHSFTGRKPRAFTLLGETHAVSSWRDLLLGVCAQLAARDGDAFITAIQPIRGKKRLYVSNKADELFNPGPIGNNGYWIETNLSAKDIARLVDRILDACNLPPDALHIELAAAPHADPA